MLSLNYALLLNDASTEALRGFSAALSAAPHSKPNSMPTQVTGSGLLSLVKDFGYDAPKSQIVSAAGYIKPDGKLAWSAFYEALLKAQDKLPSQQEVTYEESDPDQEWCQCIAEILPDVDESDARDWVANELDDLGIETEEQLRASFCGYYDTWSFCEDFGSEFIENCGERIPEILQNSISWERLWDSTLAYDFDTFDFGGKTYVFNRNAY